MTLEHATALAVRQALMHAAQNDGWRAYDGPQSERLRCLLMARFLRQHVRLCSSGTLAVELALRSLHLDSQDEVMLAGYDFPGNFRAILDAGAMVRLCDLQPGGWTVHVEQLEKVVSSHTRAIVISHLHGTLAPVHEIVRWARQRGIIIIEDVCQEPGAEIWDAKNNCFGNAGSLGDLSVLSFGGSKLLTAGRGGAVMTDHATYAQRMTVYSERGNDAFAMSELQATVLIPQLENLSADNARRREAATQLKRHLGSFPWIQGPRSGIQGFSAFYKYGLTIALHADELNRIQRITKTDGQDRSQMEVFRDSLVARLQQHDVPIGAGFRGFLRRSRRRCWREGNYEHSQSMAESTMVLHHSALMDPITGECQIDRFVHALHKIQQEYFS